MNYQIKNLRFSVNNHLLLQAFDRNFSASINLICGPNGTGKTTLLRLLGGEFSQERSPITFNGSQLNEEALKSFSLMPINTTGLLPSLSGREMITLISELKERPIIQNSIYQSNLFQKCLLMHTSNFSNGMRQIFKYYLHTFWDPQVLFLDEPFSFLDAKNTLLIKKDLIERKKNTLIFLTHQSARIEDLPIDFSLELSTHA